MSEAEARAIGKLEGCIEALTKQIDTLVKSAEALQQSLMAESNSFREKLYAHQAYDEQMHQKLSNQIDAVREDIKKLRSDVERIEAIIKSLELVDKQLQKSWGKMFTLFAKFATPILAALYADKAAGTHVAEKIMGHIK